MSVESVIFYQVLQIPPQQRSTEKNAWYFHRDHSDQYQQFANRLSITLTMVTSLLLLSMMLVVGWCRSSLMDLLHGFQLFKHQNRLCCLSSGVTGETGENPYRQHKLVDFNNYKVEQFCIRTSLCLLCSGKSVKWPMNIGEAAKGWNHGKAEWNRNKP